MSLPKKLLVLPPILIGVLVLGWMARGRKEPERSDVGEVARPVRYVTLAPEDVVPRAIAYGTVRPSKTWVATAEISGRVLSLSPLLREGEIVPADHELITIDDTDQKLEVARLKAEAEGLQAQIDKLDQSRENLGELLKVESSSLALAEGEWKAAVQAYLASISHADANIGRVLDALDRGPHKANTIIVLWSDHGYHLGEKGHWHKRTLWERATRVPLIVVAPGVTRAGETCAKPVNLIDLYPTLIDLCNVERRSELQGHSQDMKPE